MIIITSKTNPANWEMIDVGIKDCDIRNQYTDVTISDPNVAPDLIKKFGLSSNGSTILNDQFNVLMKSGEVVFNIQDCIIDVVDNKIRVLITLNTKVDYLKMGESFETLTEEQKERVIWTMNEWRKAKADWV